MKAPALDEDTTAEKGTASNLSSNTERVAVVGLEVETDASESATRGNDGNANAAAILIGTYVGRNSSDGNGKLLLGKVTSYDANTKFATIFYENGQHEVLEHQHVANLLIMDQTKLRQRKRKLDRLATVGEIGRPNTRSRKTALTEESTDVFQPLPPRSLASGYDVHKDDEKNKDLSTDSCANFDDIPVSSSPPPQVQIVSLPPSDGDINVPDKSIPDLFSVYNFLRSFSFRLFLSPFGLDDFVGSLNCTVQNSLLNAIHLSLMRALRRHLQLLSSEGSDLASKCLRYYDWNLLDPLTWPAILVGYLYTSGQMKQLDKDEFRLIISGGEYYRLPAGLKLKVLQILCDDVVDSAEIRTELEMRVDMEEPDEFTVNSRYPPESGPMRVHPRCSKTSACKNMEALENSIEPKEPIPNTKVLVSDALESDDAQDGNSDECLLCGMDGMLICCDGCPSAYHSRCIGLNKAFLPEGPWFCPECTVNKLGMTSSRIGRGTSGAEIFGIDLNGRMFLGTCNYLLVLGMSLNSEPLIRYYNSDGVTKVLSILLAAENPSAYADICRGISKYWEVPLIDMQPGKHGLIWHPFVDEKPFLGYPSSITSFNRTSDTSRDANGVHYLTNAAKGSPSGRGILYQKDHYIKEEKNGSSVGIVDKSNLSSNLTEDHDLCKNRLHEDADKTSYHIKDEKLAPEIATLTVEKTSPPSTQINFREHLHSGPFLTDTSYLSQHVYAERLNFSATSTCGLANENDTCKEDATSLNFSTKKELSGLSNENRLECPLNDEKCRTVSQRNSRFPNVFKPQAYINQYTQGEVAASAAAELAAFASEEREHSEAHASSNHRKAVAVITALQMKVFSMATLNFFWPGFDKKLTEIPRERCGWCIACKAANTGKKGCLLNVAATNAIKGSARNFNGTCAVKQVESCIPVLATQITHMEETLRGLIAGPLSDVQYNKQWHKLGRDASSFKVVKFLLLELERNIRVIVFCGDWNKLADDWSIELPSAASGMCHTGTGKKRGHVGRRPRKQSGASEFENDCSSNSWKTMFWWRGGKLLKCLLHTTALPSSMVKKAGRQGGTRRISGIHYPEGSELPIRSRQCAWRASVERCTNVSQLALQIRYLDAHVRWTDLIRPEQSHLDGKGSDIDAMAFRNAVICDKRVTENKIQYALTFSIQKHLSSRVTKKILETEKLPNGNEKLWFMEIHVPLYLIKEYEENIGLKSMPSSMMLWSHDVQRLQRRQLKNQGGLFSYLMRKVEGSSRFSCVSCGQDVSLRDTVRCSTCQGYCHKDCTTVSIAIKEDDLEFMFTCNLCHTKLAPAISGDNDTLKTHLSLPGQNQQQTDIKCMLQSKYKNLAQPVGKVEISSARKSSVSRSKSANNVRRGGPSSLYGLIWKRKKGDDSGQDFRITNILLKGRGEEAHPGVVCCLCKNPYRSDLMYIRCGSCPKWFHADAVQLEETQIFDLAGFKCCPCRRQARPTCPYADLDNKKVEAKTLSTVTGRGNETQKWMHSNSSISNSAEEDCATVDDDPLLYSSGKVEPIGEQSVDSKGQLVKQKLSVRRPLVKQGTGTHEIHATWNANFPRVEFHESLPLMFAYEQAVGRGADAKEAHTSEDPDSMDGSEKFPSTQVEWDGCKAFGGGDGACSNTDIVDQSNNAEMGISDDMEYEPQTYFSFTELLASDDQSNSQYGVPMDSSGGWLPIDFETCDSSEPVFGACEEPVLDVKPCHLCKLDEPSPDLVCEVCKLRIHSHCSPWEDIEAVLWRCGNCRDWR